MSDPFAPDDADPFNLTVNTATISFKALPPQKRNRGVFTITGDNQIGRVLSLPVQPVTTIGRSDEANLRIDDVSLSRIHARVLRVADSLVFQDAGSTNGSAVNDVVTTGPHVLKDGDRLRLGQSTTLRFQLVDEHEEQALQNVYDAAMRDGLTGAWNRKALDERLEAEVAFAVRHSAPLSVVMIDIDHFKKVNDTYGHQGGDVVLRGVALALQRGLRTEDVLGRFGGEEFCVVARGIEGAQGVILAERLRSSIAALALHHDGHSIRVTFSAGVSSLQDCGDARDKTTLVRIADSRLYRGKEGGRNRVVGP